MNLELQRSLLNQALRHLCGLEAVLRRYIAYLDKELLIETFQADGLRSMDNRPTSANLRDPDNMPPFAASILTEPAVSLKSPSLNARDDLKKGE